MPEKKFVVTVDGQAYQVEIRGADEEGVEVVLNGTSYKVSFAEIEEEIKTSTLAPTLKPPPMRVEEPVTVSPGQLVAPIPGEVVEIRVSEGETVEVGDVLLVLESMKMKNQIRSPGRGQVKRVAVSVGQSVVYGNLLIEFE